MNKYNSRIIIACDLDSKQELMILINKLEGKKLFLKLGMQILYKEGFSFINELREMGHNIFIDLKVHDIPNTAKNAVRSLLQYKPDFLTIHASGGAEMMNEISKVVKGTDTKVLAVTVLTSLNQEAIGQMNIQTPVENQVETLIKLAKDNGIDHIVCSASEAHLVKKHNLTSITPGIRLATNSNDDQKRVVTPKDAFSNGSDFIVVGRTITQSNDPLKVYEQIESEQ